MDVPRDCSHLVVERSAWPSDRAALPAFMAKLYAHEECERLSTTGWNPIAEVAAQGRQVRRITFIEGRGAYYAAVAIEWGADGRVTVSLPSTSGELLSAIVPKSVWADLMRRDALSHVRPVRPDSPPPPFHCNVVNVEAASGRKSWKSGASACLAVHASAYRYAADIAWTAIDYIPRCAPIKAAFRARSPDLRGVNDQALPILEACGGALRSTPWSAPERPTPR